MVALLLIETDVKELTQIPRMHNLRNETKPFIKSKLTLHPNIRIHNLPKQLYTLGDLLWPCRQVSYHAHTSLVILPLTDDNHNIVLVVVEVLAVNEVLVSDFGNVPA